MIEQEFKDKTKALIDSLKNICAHYGLGNDGNEFKNLHSLMLAYPTLDLLKKYDEIVTNYNKMIFERSLENSELVSLRDWLLPMLMSGQVTVK